MNTENLKRALRSRLRWPDVKKWQEDRRIHGCYEQNLQAAGIRRAPETSMAVVVHLYYVESWPLIADSLQHLRGKKFDLYVTLPAHNVEFAETIKSEYPQAFCVEVPNRGRDVLPFIMVAKELYNHGYTYLLKLHSKKSTHRTDGSEWLSDMVMKLLPADEGVMESLLSTLEQGDTGVIGPAGQYMPLTVNFEANGVHMTRIINTLYSRGTSFDVLQKRRGEFGFFAGTMFWARIDAIQPVLMSNITPKHFETESGQIDGTIAHALERLFGAIPEIEKRKMYEVSTDAVRQIAYDSGVVPDWSDVYKGPPANTDQA